jgi:acyl-CoA dehydrogenase
MNLYLTDTQRDLQGLAREFADKHLLVLEDECEAGEGLEPTRLEGLKKVIVEQRFNAINHSVADGGRGLDLFDQVLVQEQLGRVTNGLWDLCWRPSIPLRYATDLQRDAYLRPACRGERRDAYAITESLAGSDVSMVSASARRSGGDYLLNGEKWHVTSGDVADFFLVHANVDSDRDKATVFLVDKGAPGVRLLRTPKYMHTFVFEHPIFLFDDVRVPAASVLGDVGAGGLLTREWFVEERIMIGARCVGAAARALELSNVFANERVQFGSPIAGFQGVEFMLADMAAETAAAQALLYKVACQAVQDEVSRKELHALAAAVKLYCSEMAGRVIDRAVQIHGGRGYMREQPVERLWRDLRVDRIWEGTSEIQRSVIGNHLRKRGPELFTRWPRRERSPGPES